MGLREMQGARGRRAVQEATGALTLWRWNHDHERWEPKGSYDSVEYAGSVLYHYQRDEPKEIFVLAPKKPSVRAKDKGRGLTLDAVRADAERMNKPYAQHIKPQASESNYGFGEDLAADIALEKLLGHNFIDDGNLLEQDGEDPGSKVRAQLAKMDALALEIRKGLNGLVREGIGMVEEASRVDLGEGTETLAAMKPVLGRLMTAYAELVSGLQQARESVGYDVEGPSVTSLPDEGEMQERITRSFARRKTHGIAR